MDVTLIFNGVDFAPWLASYRADHEVSYKKIVTTMDGEEHTTPASRRPIVTFSFLPLTDAKAAQYYDALKIMTASVSYTDTWLNRTNTIRMRVTSTLSAVFALRAVDGNRYYKGGEIQLRAVNIL